MTSIFIYFYMFTLCAYKVYSWTDPPTSGQIQCKAHKWTGLKSTSERIQD